MKIKLLAVAVAGILLSGCNDDNGPLNSVAVQAFDPAIRGMTAVAVCTDSTTETSLTGHDGNAIFFKQTVQNSPETCAFTFTGGADAVDVSNSKSMTGVIYTIPAGMADADSPITASPLTTLIAKDLAESGNPYSEEAARLVLASIGLDTLLSDDLSVTELLSNTEAVLEKLSTTNSDGASLLAATTAVLTDVLAADPNTSVADVAAASTALTEQVLTDYSNYPEDDDGKPIFVEIPADQVDDVIADPTAPITLPDPEDAKPVPTPEPGTGTGGTGGGTGGGSGA
ncbi:MAG: hypothetical protein COA76_00165 [Moritella sp.]|uniref:hypothetical protein n=1 Tax=Moritella sp. TaxID=78556 RepID=UPI000C0DA4C1|nr:hypothetical protein [Moritella sp.]MBL1415895.1 hypothetical protein [Moritella sp.]PHR90123.1 MAG: hypothetical protein COA76_00165 [Moritella sp.]